PHDLRSGIGEWLFGCDVCQDVCPWNHKSVRGTDTNFLPTADSNPIDLIALFDLNDDAFRSRFRHTPLWRARRRGILRNAAIVLGNQRACAALPALIRSLSDPEPLIRGASAWALSQVGGDEALTALKERHAVEVNET